MLPLPDALSPAALGIIAAGIIGGVQWMVFEVTGLTDRLTEPQLTLVKLPLPTIALGLGLSSSSLYSTGGVVMALLIAIGVTVWFDYLELVGYLPTLSDD